MPNSDFPDPNITCTWVADDRIFLNLFHNHSKTHYHFIWDINKRKIVGNNGKVIAK